MKRVTILRKTFIILTAFNLVACVSASGSAEQLKDGEFRRTINGINHWFRILGAGKSAVPMVFVHGGPGGSSYQFEQTAARDLARDFTVIVYDQRGCGRSAMPANDDFSVASLASDLNGLRQEIGAEKIGLLGSSFGGEVALQYALEHPNHVKYLVLEGPSNGDHFTLMEMQYRNFVEIAPSEVRRNLRRIWSEERPLPDRYFKMWAAIDTPTANRFIFHHLENADLVRRIWDSQKWESNQKMADAVWSHPPSQPYLYQRARTLKLPVFIGVGKFDYNTGIPLSKKIHEALPSSKLVVFNQSGHFPDVEEADLFRKEVSDFIRNQ